MPAAAVNGQRRLGPALAMGLGCVVALGAAASIVQVRIAETKRKRFSSLVTGHSSARMPASLITLLILAISDFTVARSWSGVLPTVSTPALKNFSFTLG